MEKRENTVTFLEASKVARIFLESSSILSVSERGKDTMSCTLRESSKWMKSEYYDGKRRPAHVVSPVSMSRSAHECSSNPRGLCLEEPQGEGDAFACFYPYESGTEDLGDLLREMRDGPVGKDNSRIWEMSDMDGFGSAPTGALPQNTYGSFLPGSVSGAGIVSNTHNNNQEYAEQQMAANIRDTAGTRDTARGQEESGGMKAPIPAQQWMQPQYPLMSQDPRQTFMHRNGDGLHQDPRMHQQNGKQQVMYMQPVPVPIESTAFNTALPAGQSPDKAKEGDPRWATLPIQWYVPISQYGPQQIMYMQALMASQQQMGQNIKEGKSNLNNKSGSDSDSGQGTHVVPEFLGMSGPYVGHLRERSSSGSNFSSSLAHRRACVERYRRKRSRRSFSKHIRYQTRKTMADKRPRVKGRFIKVIEGEACCSGSEMDNRGSC